MSGLLLDYGKKFKDANIDDPKIKADITWAVNGTGVYQSAPVSRSPKKRKKKKQVKDNDE